MQNPPPGQQNYGSAPGAPPPGTPSPGTSQTGGTGLDPKVAAAISYIWIVGLIFFFIEKENKFVRFHAMQSILFGIANSVIMMVLAVVATILTVVFTVGAAAAASAGSGGLGAIVSLFVWLIWLVFWVLAMVFLVGLILAAVKAYQGQKFKLPIIGNMAEKIVNK